MPTKCSYLWLVLMLIFQFSFAERRIKDGYVVGSDKKYVVYLLKASSAPVAYRGWTCGGAIVSPSFVITSAACVEDVQHMYVIAGYNKFISSEDIDRDECTKKFKKKVIFTCVPKDYKLDYNLTEFWSRIDIAVIKVESPFNFQDQEYEILCSYMPAPIEINYESKYQMPGTDAMVLGWGHAYEYRKDKEENSFNQKLLHYAPTRILDKDTCVNYFDDNNMPTIIYKYMICTLEAGNLNDKGELILKSPPVLEGCITIKDKLQGAEGKLCDGEQNDESGSEIPGSHYNLEYEEEKVSGGDIFVLDTAIHDNPNSSGRKKQNSILKVEDASDNPDQGYNEEYKEEVAGGPIFLFDDKKRRLENGNLKEKEIEKAYAKKVSTIGILRKDNTEYKYNGREVNRSLEQERNKLQENKTREITLGVAHEKNGTTKYTVRRENKDDALRQLDDPVYTPGICQNDHGGPLVTWVGTHEVLIGVATLFKLDSKRRCMGPYLYTSTQCNSAFLNCILSMEHKAEAQLRCDDLRRQGFELVERRVSWIGHPDGAAANEIVHQRLQVPMSAIRAI